MGGAMMALMAIMGALKASQEGEQTTNQNYQDIASSLANSQQGRPPQLNIPSMGSSGLSSPSIYFPSLNLGGEFSTVTPQSLARAMALSPMYKGTDRPNVSSVSPAQLNLTRAQPERTDAENLLARLAMQPLSIAGATGAGGGPVQQKPPFDVPDLGPLPTYIPVEEAAPSGPQPIPPAPTQEQLAREELIRAQQAAAPAVEQQIQQSRANDAKANARIQQANQRIGPWDPNLSVAGNLVNIADFISGLAGQGSSGLLGQNMASRYDARAAAQQGLGYGQQAMSAAGFPAGGMPATSAQSKRKAAQQAISTVSGAVSLANKYQTQALLIPEGPQQDAFFESAQLKFEAETGVLPESDVAKAFNREMRSRSPFDGLDVIGMANADELFRVATLDGDIGEMAERMTKPEFIANRKKYAIEKWQNSGGMSEADATLKVWRDQFGFSDNPSADEVAAMNARVGLDNKLPEGTLTAMEDPGIADHFNVRRDVEIEAFNKARASAQARAEYRAPQKPTSPFGKIDPAKYTTDSLQKFSETGKWSDLVFRDSPKSDKDDKENAAAISDSTAMIAHVMMVRDMAQGLKRGGFGWRGEKALEAGGVIGTLASDEVAEYWTKTLSGGATQDDIAQFRLAAQSLGPKLVPMFTGEQTGRITDRELGITNNAIRVIATSTNKEQVASASNQLLKQLLLNEERMRSIRNQELRFDLSTQEGVRKARSDLRSTFGFSDKDAQAFMLQRQQEENVGLGNIQWARQQQVEVEK